MKTTLSKKIAAVFLCGTLAFGFAGTVSAASSSRAPVRNQIHRNVKPAPTPARHVQHRPTRPAPPPSSRSGYHVSPSRHHDTHRDRNNGDNAIGGILIGALLSGMFK